jgi:hypothetical protein
VLRLKTSILVFAALTAGALMAACSETNDETARSESKKQTENYAQVVNDQPARGMSHSPTRDALNRWAETWEESGKLAYIYLFDAQGDLLGYYIFDGLPVSYCASLTPTEKIVDTEEELNEGASVDAAVTTAPAIDGVYYSAANCQQMFGFDAVSGAYLEFTGGGSFNYLLSDSPMTTFKGKNLGDAKIGEVE